ncbi:hypothetical protein [Bremerella cremea]|uniref:hypothetical protein n=1 Tax=Bremerella cremea TaxID=1031537 RepID=UPI0031F0EEF2
MFRKTTLAACVMFAAPAAIYAQAPTWKWVDATYNEGHPITQMAAPGDLKDPNAIALSSSNGTADQTRTIQRTSAMQNIGGQPTPAQRNSTVRTYVGEPIQSLNPTAYTPPSSQETIVQYSNEPRTVIYDNPQPLQQQTTVQRVEYNSYPTESTYYVEPVQPNAWHTINNSVQRVQYNTPAAYSTPVYSTTGTPVTVYRPVTQVTYNNPPVGTAPVLSPPIVSAPIAVPPAAVYPVDRTSFRPVLPIFSMSDNSYVGRGLLGQPKVYTEGQPIRNSLRYVLP